MSDSNEKEIEDLINMIDGKMEGGVSRLSVGFSEKESEGFQKEDRYYGKRDSWDPWPWGESSGGPVREE